MGSRDALAREERDEARRAALMPAVGHLRAALVLLDAAGEALAAIDVSHALALLGHEETVPDGDGPAH